MNENDKNNNDSSQPSDLEEVEVFHRVNRLKRKAGGDPYSDIEGGIAQELIDDADSKITDFCGDCRTHIEEPMNELFATWAKFKQNNDDRTLVEDMFNQAHQIKDISGMCACALLCDFAESLRDYLHKTNLDHDAHIKIIQAHIDVINIVFKEEVKDDNDPAAKELRALLDKAIEQYG